MAPASIKILFTIRVFYTHESLSIVQPYHFQADLIWCDAAGKPESRKVYSHGHADYNEIGRLRYLLWSYGTPLYPIYMEKALPSPLLDSVPGEVKVRGKQNKVERIKQNKGHNLERN
jgi:hypothetical protein